MHFATLLDHRSAAHAEGAALADEHNGVVTNARLAGRVDSAAAQLRLAGVRAGDVVAVKLPNRVELVVALFAAWKLGAAALPINPSLTQTEVGHQLADSAARVVITDDADDHRISVVRLAELDVPVPDDLPGPEVRHHGDDVALLIYTSGTTGRPKGVELTHDNVLAMAESINTAMNSGPHTHSLLILPLFHVNGIIVSVLAPLLAGGRATIASRFHPTTFFGLVEAHRPTYFSAVPTIYAMLAALPSDVPPDTASLEFAICGAAPMPPGLIADFEQRYGVPIIEGYGLSEGTCASTTNPLNGTRKMGTVGVALPGQRVAVRGADGTFLAAGTPGEVVVSGPTVMRGYRNRPQETSETIVDGWLRTGDIGFLDGDGYLTLVDRAKDMIIRGGENIYPKEIETALYTHPGVREVAVVGRPDAVYGQVPVAFITARPEFDVSSSHVTDHVLQSLAKYKLPELIFVADIPKNAVGKIDKPALRRRFATTPTSTQGRKGPTS